MTQLGRGESERGNGAREKRARWTSQSPVGVLREFARPSVFGDRDRSSIARHRDDRESAHGGISVAAHPRLD